MTDGPDAPRLRDRAATQTALVAATRALLAEIGFQGLGINAIARRAGCDKQLIYRYFGGLDGLIDALGTEIADDLRRKLQPLASPDRPASYGELVERMVLGFLHVLRQDALMCRIMAWEIAEPSPQIQRLTLARSKSMMAWVAESRGDLVPPAGRDAPALNAALLAAVQHLVLSGAAAGQFSGLPLACDDHWRRAEDAIRALVRGAYPPET